MATASAEPESKRLSVGGGVEVFKDVGEYAPTGVYGGLSVEAAYQLGHTPLFARAQVSRGIRFGDGDGDARTDYTHVRLGLEVRQRLGVDWLHAYGGIDAGFARFAATDVMTQVPIDTTLALTVVPRAGIQIGQRIYGRLGVEVPIVFPDAGSDVAVAVSGTIGATF